MKFLSEHPFGQAGLRARMFQMDNQLRVLLLADKAAPIFAYQTWFRVGSRHEQKGKTGMAHLFEHLMFNETQNLKPGEFDRLLELAGGHSNAATWVDWTYYQNDLPKADLELVIRLEADRMQNLVVRERQVESEREVVMNERRFRVEDDVDGFLNEELFRLSFSHHPYHWPTIGWMDDIKGLSVDDAMAFYKTYYAPNNATLVIVGDIEEEPTLALVEKAYGKIPAQAIPEELPVHEPIQEGERSGHYRKPVSTDKLLVGYKSPSALDPEFLHLELLSDVLFGGGSSRLYRELVVDKEIAITIAGSVMPFAHPGLFEISASMQRGHSANEALEIIDRQIDDMLTSRSPLKEADLARSKARFLTHFYSSMRSCHGRAESLGYHETTLGDYRLLFATPERLEKVGVGDLLHAGRKYLLPERRTVITATPIDPTDDADDDEESSK